MQDSYVNVLNSQWNVVFSEYSDFLELHVYKVVSVLVGWGGGCQCTYLFNDFIRVDACNILLKLCPYLPNSFNFLQHKRLNFFAYKPFVSHLYCFYFYCDVIVGVSKWRHNLLNACIFEVVHKIHCTVFLILKLKTCSWRYVASGLKKIFQKSF